jgi:3-hydroxyisobutyrate dehydrogenase-like beta-hydroxyacid dehydrogenase
VTVPACIGIYSPGDMGGAVGAVLGRGGLRVVAALKGRSERTRRLAAQAGIEDVGSLEALAREAGMVLAILVPGQAEAAAGAMAAAMEATGARPLYVDCNAVAAETSVRVGEIVARAGAPRHLVAMRPRPFQLLHRL